MATLSEIHSLEDIQYKNKIRPIFLILLGLFLFIMAFLNFYPIGTMLKTQLKNNLGASGCNPDFDQIRIEWLMPKIIVSNLVIPANCLNREGEALKLNFVSLNYQLINFSPLGLPFRLDTEISGQPLSVYYVQGFGEQLIRLKDQKLVLSRLESILGKNLKLSGSVVVDMSLSLTDQSVKSMTLKAISKDFQIPAQRLMDFPIPNLKLNEFYLEAEANNPPTIAINKLILGDSNAPIRANLRGKIIKAIGDFSNSPLDLSGEVSLDEKIRQTQPLLEMMLQSFPQKDGFYQVRLSGTLGAPKTAL